MHFVSIDLKINKEMKYTLLSVLFLKHSEIHFKAYLRKNTVYLLCFVEIILISNILTC